MRIRKTTIYLILIVVLAIILRVIAAHSTGIGTDEMIYSLLPLNIIGSGQLNTIEQAPLFFYLTDIGYKLFGGITAISARLASIIFGALASLVIFLITHDFFKDKKAGIISAFLFAVSGFAISHNVEMDMTSFFFALLSILFFMRFFSNTKNLYLSSLFLVLGSLSKPIILILIFPYIIVFLIDYLKKNKIDGTLKLNKRLIKVISLSVLIAVLVASPVLIYNYFTYQNLGSSDYYFASILGFGEYPLKGVSQQVWNVPKFVSNSKQIIFDFFKHDTILLLFGIIGSVMFFRKNLLYSITLWSSALLILFYVGGKVGGSQHQLLVPAVLSIFGGYAILKSGSWIKNKFSFKHFTLIILLIAVVLTSVTMQKITASRENSTTLVLRDFTVDNIPPESVVVTDPRIFTGVHAWVFNDRYYISGTDFSRIIPALNDVPEDQTVLVPVYYLECNPITYCGWKPEDFNRISKVGEEITEQFKKISDPVADIKASHNFIIHSAIMQIPIQLFDIIDQGKSFWGYPIGWNYPENAIDYYEVRGFGKAVNTFGLIVLFIDVFIALLSIPFVIYLVKLSS